MKPVPASLTAMFVGWAVPLLGVATSQLVRFGRTSDVGVVALWIGLFAFAGWAVGVLPFISRFSRMPLVSDIRWSWLSWSVYAIAVYLILVTPVMGKEAFEVLWFPALMGLIAGVTFPRLVRGVPPPGANQRIGLHRERR